MPAEERPFGACPKCGAPYPTATDLCPHCGARVDADGLAEHEAEYSEPKVDAQFDAAAPPSVAESPPRPISDPGLSGAISLSVPEWKAVVTQPLQEANVGVATQRAAAAVSLVPPTRPAPWILRTVTMAGADGPEPPMLLQGGESMMFCLDNIILVEPHSVSTGVYGGPSIRLGRVSIRGGGFRSESHEELREVDRGMLVLTDRRLVFAGEKRSVDIALPKLTAVEGQEDTLVVHTAGTEKTRMFVGFNSQTARFEVPGRAYDGLVTGAKVQEAIGTLVHYCR